MQKNLVIGLIGGCLLGWLGNTVFTSYRNYQQAILDCRFNPATGVTICVPKGKWNASNSAGFVPVQNANSGD